MRRQLAALALSALALPVPAAHADPFVGKIGNANGTVRLKGTDGQAYAVTFDVIAVQPQGGTASYQLNITIVKCTFSECPDGRPTTLQLSGSQITAAADMSTVSVKVTTLGTPLTLTWNASEDMDPTGGGVSVHAASVSSDINNTDYAADLRVVGWGASCRTSGTYSDPTIVSAPDGYAADSGPAPVRSTPRQFVAHGRKKVTCLG